MRLARQVADDQTKIAQAITRKPDCLKYLSNAHTNKSEVSKAHHSQQSKTNVVIHIMFVSEINMSREHSSELAVRRALKCAIPI